MLLIIFPHLAICFALAAISSTSPVDGNGKQPSERTFETLPPRLVPRIIIESTYEDRLSALMDSRQAAIDQCLRFPECARVLPTQFSTREKCPWLLWSISVGVEDEQKAIILVPLFTNKLSEQEFRLLETTSITPDQSNWMHMNDPYFDSVSGSATMNTLAKNYSSSRIVRLGTMLSIMDFDNLVFEAMTSENLRVGTGSRPRFIMWYNEIIRTLRGSGKLLPIPGSANFG